MNQKVLILGSGGLTGHQVYDYLENHSDFELFDISQSHKFNSNTVLLDAKDEVNFLKMIRKIQPSIIINLIGVLIGRSEKEPDSAIYLNAYLPHILAKVSNELNSKLIHISTDCVFSGNKNTPYVEFDEKDGKGFYAKTKSMGEVIHSNHLTIRTSVIGPELINTNEGLFDWFMHQSNQIDGWTKTIWSGVSTLELAKSVLWFIENDTSGLYHLTNGIPISKYDLLEMFKRFSGKKIKINRVDGINEDKSFVDTRNELTYQIPNYEEMVSKMIAMTKSKSNLYKNYFL